jgi:hypothetical protein
VAKQVNHKQLSKTIPTAAMGGFKTRTNSAQELKVDHLGIMERVTLSSESSQPVCLYLHQADKKASANTKITSKGCKTVNFKQLEAYKQILIRINSHN